MKLSIEQVRWVAALARLELGEDELGPVTEQLQSVITFFDQLSQVDTEGVEPLAHPLPIQNVFRDDEPRPSLPVDEALAKIEANGGKILRPKGAVPGVGWLAYCQDTEGNTFGLMQRDPTAK